MASSMDETGMDETDTYESDALAALVGMNP